ncbi:MAG: helix-turn-helix transcriptional regulator [Actinobacteria bacterium]|nr:helix-turn-helix transcriptional regulator [Actinomycetota bacterium]
MSVAAIARERSRAASARPARTDRGIDTERVGVHAGTGPGRRDRPPCSASPSSPSCSQPRSPPSSASTCSSGPASPARAPSLRRPRTLPANGEPAAGAASPARPISHGTAARTTASARARSTGAARLRSCRFPRLLDRLCDGEASVQELTEALGASQQNVSKHLGILHQAGVVGRRKAGNHVYYSIADDSVLGLCEQVCGGLSQRLAGLADLLEGSIR